uniref:5-aminolevulinate synthase n=1 Tax=Rodentolepis nana TaxID=102285 RepID=A0A0R3TS44_RODNA
LNICTFSLIHFSRKAIERFGVGSGGTRNISGNSLLHEALEHELADLHNKEAGLLFTSCFVANEAILYTLGTLIPDLKFFSDASNHASIIHGIRTSRAPKFIYPENDLNKLDELMTTESSPSAPKLVACETVHSMNGTISSIEQFLDVCEKHNALSFVDEVHAVGLYGDRGAGVAEERGCMHRIDAITGTLGKAYASIGGYLVGDRALVDMIRSYAGGLIFTTSLPPPTLAAARTSIAILKTSEGRQLRDEHRRRVSIVRRRLQEAGLPTPDLPSHVIPIFVGSPEICLSISEELLSKHQIYLQSINYPTVAKGTERLRLAPSPFHNDEMTDHLVNALVKVWKSHKLPLKH